MAEGIQFSVGMPGLMEGLAYDGEMGKTVDAAAPDYHRATFVPQFLEPPQIKQQGLRIAIEMGHQVAARLLPELKLVPLRP